MVKIVIVKYLCPNLHKLSTVGKCYFTKKQQI